MPTPPLMPFILFLLGASQVAEYMYIALVSAFFAYSAARFSKAARLRKEIFYVLLLSAPLTFYAFLNGTELLSLSLLILFLALWIEKKSYAPIFLGLSILARYNMIVFLPLIFLSRKPVKIIKNTAFLILPVAAWLLCNLLSTGNMFTTLADVYALSFKYRFYINQPTNYLHIIEWMGFLTPLFLAGLYAKLRKPATKFLTENKTSLVFVLIIALVIFQYTSNPIKNSRYLFTLALPVAYFSYMGLDKARKNKKLLISIISAILILNSIFLINMNFSANYEGREKYADAITTLKDLNMSNCRTFTNAWPLMNYMGKISETYRPKELLQRNIDEGIVILLFFNTNDPDWAENKTFLRRFPVLHESGEFIILGKGSCAGERAFTHSYVMLFQENTLLMHNVTVNSNPCFVLFSSNHIAESMCNFINFRGFKADENREDGIRLKEINTFYLAAG